MAEVNFDNDSLVGVHGDNITSLVLGFSLPRERALRMAAWISVLADPIGDEFRALRDAIEGQ